MEFKNVFITGSDKNNEWMLEWFLTNYRMHNTTPIIFANFGVSESVLKWAEKSFDGIIDMPKPKSIAWFLKPQSMIEASKLSKKVCWIDTDCHVIQSIDNIFKYTTPQKLSMAVDRPWTKRTGVIWHNSGIVAFEGTPNILVSWEKNVRSSKQRGDQEVLHEMMDNDQLTRMIHIEDLPNVYNWLRLQLIDGSDNINKKVMHWTGNKGKDVIKEMIRNA